MSERPRTLAVVLGNEECWAVETSKDGERWRFFGKGWTNHELDGLVTRTVAGEQSLLPIWHNLTAADVRRYSPSLADKVALSTTDYTIEEIAGQIADVVLDEKSFA